MECSITHVIFEPTFTLNGIPISVILCQASSEWKTDDHMRLPT